jgi:hypothetical protein
LGGLLVRLKIVNLNEVQVMASNLGQGTGQNHDEEDRENMLPVPIESARTIKESVGKTYVDPEDIAEEVSYGDDGYNESGLLTNDF